MNLISEILHFLLFLEMPKTFLLCNLNWEKWMEWIFFFRGEDTPCLVWEWKEHTHLTKENKFQMLLHNREENETNNKNFLEFWLLKNFVSFILQNLQHKHQVSTNGGTYRHVFGSFGLIFQFVDCWRLILTNHTNTRYDFKLASKKSEN
jgi:hypothetical protein